MSPLHQLLLLRLIRKNGDVSMFLRKGFTYAQIFKQIEEFKEHSLVVLNQEEGVINITQKGIGKIDEMNKLSGMADSNAWIMPLYEQKVKSIEINAVYLPKSITKQ
jgi:hypothetical protein